MCLNFFFFRDDSERLLCWLDHWLSCILDCIHVYVFSLSKNWFLLKKNKKRLDTSSTPCYLLRFFSCFLLLSWQLLDTWWIDWESSCLLDSFSTPAGSIELLFLDLMSCSSIPQLSTTISSIPTLIASLIPLDTCIYRALLKVYIFILRDPILIYSISLDLFASIHLPNILSLTPNLSSSVIFQAFSRFSSLSKFLISHSSCFSWFET